MTDEARSITGSVFTIDGGRTAVSQSAPAPLTWIRCAMLAR